MTFSTSTIGYLAQWDVQTGEIIRTFAQQPNLITDIDVTPDGTRLIAAVYDGTARIFDTATGELLLTLEGHRTGAGVRTARFSPNQSTIITASDDNTLILWDAVTGERLRRYVGNQIVDLGPMAAFSADGRTIISAANDWIVVWDAALLTGGLEAWISENRYIAPFTCEQRTLYHIEPLCLEIVANGGT